MNKANKSYLFKIISLVLVLFITLAGMIMWTDYRMKQDLVTVVVANEEITMDYEIQTADKDIKFALKSVHRTAVPENAITSMERLQEFKTKSIISKGTILTDSMLLPKTAVVEPVETNRVNFPVSVKASEVTGGSLRLGDKVLIYGINEIPGEDKKDTWVGVVSNDAQVVAISGDFSKGSASVTFSIKKEDLNNIIAISKFGELFYLTDAQFSSGNEAMISSVLENLRQSTSSHTKNLPLELVNLDLKQNEIKIFEKGINFVWANFEPEFVKVSHYTFDGGFGSYTGLYSRNNPEPSRSISYDKLTGFYTFPSVRVGFDIYTFAKEGYYEIEMTRTKTDGEGRKYQERNFYKFIIEDDAYEWKSRIENKNPDNSYSVSNKWTYLYDEQLNLIDSMTGMVFYKEYFLNIEKLQDKGLRVGEEITGDFKEFAFKEKARYIENYYSIFPFRISYRSNERIFNIPTLDVKPSDTQINYLLSYFGDNLNQEQKDQFVSLLKENYYFNEIQELIDYLDTNMIPETAIHYLLFENLGGTLTKEQKLETFKLFDQNSSEPYELVIEYINETNPDNPIQVKIPIDILYEGMYDEGGY